MKKILFFAAMGGMAAAMLTAQTRENDPVVMTVDNRDVTLSEFEYLYNKNNSQQLSPMTFDEYVDMFLNYKLKVADALANKLDTLGSFNAEYSKFRRELAEPYLKDSITYENLVNEAYSHYKDEVYVSHIMLSGQDPTAEHRLDSIRNLILSGAITFEDAARENSIDRGSSYRGGAMGWVTGTSNFPWAFEKASYDTPVGQISEVVFSGPGYHLVRPDERRHTRGEVHVQHILLLTQNMDSVAQLAVKERIDSVYGALKAGADFSDLARRLSQDPGSARDGGTLGWFGAGRMVAEFDSVAFALPNGEMSEPFKTSYGYHIVKKLASRTMLPLKTVRPDIERAIAQDDRAALPAQVLIDRTAQATGSSISPDYLAVVDQILNDGDGEVSDEVITALRKNNTVAYTVAGTDYTLANALTGSRIRPGISKKQARNMVERQVKRAFNEAITNIEIDKLEVEEPAFRNLVNEYRDGILLFDISNQKVWDYAAKDKKGQEKFFKKNRKKYSTWNSPRFKAYVVFTNDSLINEVKDYFDKTYGGKTLAQIDQEKLTDDIKSRYGRSVRVERVLAAKGENPITDYLAFGGEKPQPKNETYKQYFAFAAETVDQPTEVADVKGAVITDYQQVLENEWVKKLRKKYKWTINRDVLEKARK